MRWFLRRIQEYEYCDGATNYLRVAISILFWHFYECAFRAFRFFSEFESHVWEGCLPFSLDSQQDRLPG